MMMLRAPKNSQHSAECFDQIKVDSRSERGLSVESGSLSKGFCFPDSFLGVN